MSTVQEILTAMDKLTREELRIVRLGLDSRLSDDDNDPALLAALKDAIAYADAHPDEARSIDEVRALIPPMDFRVEIKHPAIADLAEIVSYIARDNPDAATALGSNLLDAALSLAETPYKGSPHKKLAGVRKLTLRPFKIFYRVHEARNIVEVLRFWHAARTEPEL